MHQKIRSVNRLAAGAVLDRFVGLPTVSRSVHIIRAVGQPTASGVGRLRKVG